MAEDPTGGGQRTEEEGRTTADAELLRRYVEERAEDAFAGLVRRYLPLVYHAALRQIGGDASAAEDVTQVVFTRLAQKAVSLAHHQTLAGWLHTTTRFAASEAMRAERRRRIREQEAYHMHALTADRNEGEEWARLRPVIDDALGELNDRDREAVLLRFFADLPLAQVGTKLGLSENTARMRVERALEKLRGVLARREITSTTAALGLALAGHSVTAAVPPDLAAAVTGKALATATAAGATTPAFNLFQLMSSTKFGAGLAGLLAVIAIGVAMREVLERRAGDAALAAVGRNYDALIARRSAVAQRGDAAERETAQLKVQVDEANAAQAAAMARTAAAAAAAKVAEAWDPLMEGRAFLARHPEVRDALIDWRRAETDARYGSLYRSLTAAQIEEFRTILQETQSPMRSLGPGQRMVALSLGENPGASRSPVLRALLGEEGFRQLEEIDRAAPARDLVVRLGGALAFTDTPLTVAQAEQVRQVTVASQAPGRGRSPGRIDWNVLVANAGGVLSAPQLAVLDDMRTRELASAAFNAANAPKK